MDLLHHLKRATSHSQMPLAWRAAMGLEISRLTKETVQKCNQHSLVNEPKELEESAIDRLHCIALPLSTRSLQASKKLSAKKEPQKTRFKEKSATVHLWHHQLWMSPMVQTLHAQTCFVEPHLDQLLYNWWKTIISTLE